MIPIFFDICTGKTAKSPFDHSEFWWTEGNGSCDCNRHQGFIGLELNHDFGMCLGNKRFIAIDIEGDLEGHPKDVLLMAMNAEYCK